MNEIVVLIARCLLFVYGLGVIIMMIVIAITALSVKPAHKSELPPVLDAVAKIIGAVAAALTWPFILYNARKYIHKD